MSRVIAVSLTVAASDLPVRQLQVQKAMTKVADVPADSQRGATPLARGYESCRRAVVLLPYLIAILMIILVMLFAAGAGH